jgi:hypothetical protein
MYKYSDRLPRSFERFVLKIIKRLQDGSNVLLRIPAPNLNPEFIKIFQRTNKRHAGPDTEHLDASKKPESRSLVAFLNSEGSRTGHGRRRQNITDHFKPQNGHFSVIAINGLDSWSQAAQENAARELVEIARYTKGLGKKSARAEGARFLAFVSPMFPVPADAGDMDIVDWWGVTTKADHEFLFEEYMFDRQEPYTQEMYWWLKALAFSVGGDDPSLIKAIADKAPQTIGEVKAMLLEHPLARNRKIMEGPQKHLLFRSLSPDPGKPPSSGSERLLWSMGLLAPSRYGLYHPVMLAQDEELLEKYMAIGQREVFFPLIDQVHSFFSYILEEKLGFPPEELYVDDPNREELTDKLKVEISGLLYTLIYRVKKTQHDFYECQSIIDVAKSWTQIRHQNAHTQAVPYGEFKRAFDSYEQIYRFLTPNGSKS